MTLGKPSFGSLGQHTRSLLNLPLTDESRVGRHHHSGSDPTISMNNRVSAGAAPGLAASEQTTPKLLKKRKSRLGLLSSLIPSLGTSQPAAGATGSGPYAEGATGPTGAAATPPSHPPAPAPHHHRINILSRKPVAVQQVSSLHQAFPVPLPPPPPPQSLQSQPPHNHYRHSPSPSTSSTSSSSHQHHYHHSYHQHPQSQPPPPPPPLAPPPSPPHPVMPPPPVPASSSSESVSTREPSTQPSLVESYSYNNNYYSSHSSKNISSSNVRSVSANHQFEAYNPASDPTDTRNTGNNGFDFDFVESPPMATIPSTPMVTGRSSSPADVAMSPENPAPVPRSMTPVQHQRSQHTQSRPQSGRSTPDMSNTPEIQLTGTTPSPESARRREPKRTRSSSLRGPAEQNLKVTAAARAGDYKPSFSDPKARSVSEHSPRRTADGPQQPRVVSVDARPMSQAAMLDSAGKAKVRKTLFSAAQSRSNSHDLGQAHNSAAAWIVSDESGSDYSTYFLTNGERVPELWNESSNVYVWIEPRESGGKGPSFKVPTTVLSSSTLFRRQMREQLPPVNAPSAVDKPREYHVQVPSSNSSAAAVPSESNLERLVAVRNLFAFLTGQPLVATSSQSSLFAVLINVSTLLDEFDFSSPDGKTFGEIPDVCFSFIMSQVPIADVRHSYEKTLEALVLGERMRCKKLYHEAFAHAVGKYAAIQATKSPTFHLLSAATQSRLERSHLGLVSRQDTLNNKLEQFDFPALFAGIASSNSASREVNFARWKTAFSRMRSFVLGYYRSSVGSWPPKASSKKNPFSESGLNRQVLKMLYSDLCALYDLMVDRESLSTRLGGDPPTEPDAESDDENKVNIHYLRKILDEYDTSTPPVVPPIPYDIPQLPTMSSVHDNYNALSAKEQQAFDRKIQQQELRLVLSNAYNVDTFKLKLPFLDEFKAFEAKEARGLAGGKSMAEIIDQRIGYWLFLYSVMQALPMLVVDAPDVQHTDKVEYFLCQPPMGPLPWIENSDRKMWFEVAGGGVVELPPEAVKYSVHATYHRSHCWLSAKIWEEALTFSTFGGIPTPPVAGLAASPFEPPNPGFVEGVQSPEAGASKSAGASPSLVPLTTGTSPPSGSPQYALRPRNLSPAARARAFTPGGHVYRSSIVLGIEPLALPENNYGGHRHASSALYSSSGQSDSGMPRSASHGNLRQMAEMPARGGSPLARPGNPRTISVGSTYDDSANGDSADHTFDDILTKVDKRQRKARKWGIF